jgi:chromosome segregation ATPase
MQRLLLVSLLGLILLSTVQGAIEPPKPKTSEPYETNLEKLVALKDSTFEKYSKAWATISDWTATITEDIKAAYRIASEDYYKAKEALWKFGTENLESATERYEETKKKIDEQEKQLRTRAKDFRKGIDEYSEEEWKLRQKDNEELEENRRRFTGVREQLERYYSNAYRYGKQDYDYAKGVVDKLTQDLKSYPKSAGAEGKKRLQENLDAAKKDFVAAEKNLEEVKIKANKFYDSAREFASHEEEWAKNNLDYWTKTAREYAESARDKTAAVYENAMARLESAKNEAIEQFESAQEAVHSLREILENWTEQAKEFAEESYEKIKSEL